MLLDGGTDILWRFVQTGITDKGSDVSLLVCHFDYVIALFFVRCPRFFLLRYYKVNQPNEAIIEPPAPLPKPFGARKW